MVEGALSHFQSLRLFYGTYLSLSPLLCIRLVSPGRLCSLQRDICKLTSHARYGEAYFPVSPDGIYYTSEKCMSPQRRHYFFFSMEEDALTLDWRRVYTR